MNVIASIQGSVALHVSSDDVMPERGILMREMIAFVGNAYDFSIKPEIPPGVLPQAIPFILFHSGKLVRESESYPIVQILMSNDGVIVTAHTTDIADIILDDFIARLDNELGYRFQSSSRRKAYLSLIVVQFDEPLEELFAIFTKIEEIINREIPRSDAPFKIKRLAFGYGDVALPNITTLEAVEKADFLIERRAGEPYSKNRYFSSAPLCTEDNARVLGLIQQISADRRGR